MRLFVRTLVLVQRIATSLRFRWDKVQLDHIGLGHRGENVQLMPKGRIISPQNVTIHDDVYVGPGFWISAIGGLTVGSGVTIGPRLRIYTANHNYEHAKCLPYDDRILAEPVRIGDNCWIGGDVIILPGVELGEGCVVGAGSVVTKSFGPGKVLGGYPARVLKERDMHHYHTLKQENMIYLKLKKGRSDEA